MEANEEYPEPEEVLRDVERILNEVQSISCSQRAINSSQQKFLGAVHRFTIAINTAAQKFAEETVASVHRAEAGSNSGSDHCPDNTPLNRSDSGKSPALPPDFTIESTRT